MAKIPVIEKLEDCYKELTKPNVTLKTKYSFTYKKKTIFTQLGRIWFNLTLPDNYPEFVDEPVNKSKLEEICYNILQLNEPADAARYIDNIQKEAFKLATFNPITFNQDSFIIPDKIKKERDNLKNSDVKLEDYNTLSVNIAKEFLDKYDHDSLDSLVYSKSTGKLNPDALAIWLIGKGPILDIENKISKPIKSSLIDGYTGEEYYLAASEARRGNFIRGVGTSDPGTLARHIAFALSNIKLTKSDCKSKKYLSLFINESNFNLLQGRYYLNEKTNKLERITKKDKNLINSMVKLRSPIYCKDPNGICPICFSKTIEDYGTTNIGLIAAAVMNKTGVQGYSMAARHAASTVNLKKCDFTKDLVEI